MLNNMKTRTIETIAYGQPMDMGGFPIRQALPSTKADMIDPFLLLHHANIKVAEKIEIITTTTKIKEQAKIKERAKIEKVNVAFNEIIPPAYLKTERGEFRVSVNVKDTPSEKNYYKWDWYNIKKINWCRRIKMDTS